MARSARYDRIGNTYGRFRRTEPTWLAEIDDALGPAQSVLNVGAGTGNYEQLDRSVVALEPARTMIDQRSPFGAPVVQGVAEALPFASDSFDAVMGELTMHHWADVSVGLNEAARVAPRQVFTVYETVEARDFWLGDYFPHMSKSELEIGAPTPEFIASVLDVVAVRTLWVPRECHEGFLASSWARPENYLDPDRRSAMSSFALADSEEVEQGVSALRHDIETGEWRRRYTDLVGLDRADFGYRLVVCCGRV